jgi:DNA-binding MarR family transcriptional regulator
MLRYIHHAEKCTSSELAEAFDVNKSAITAIINRLVEKDLIDRERDETDRRVVYLTLSRSGADLFEKTEKRIHKLVESIITKFDTEEITGFIVTYEKLSEMLQKMEKEQLGE